MLHSGKAIQRLSENSAAPWRFPFNRSVCSPESARGLSRTKTSLSSKKFSNVSFQVPVSNITSLYYVTWACSARKVKFARVLSFVSIHFMVVLLLVLERVKCIVLCCVVMCLWDVCLCLQMYTYIFTCLGRGQKTTSGTISLVLTPCCRG